LKHLDAGSLEHDEALGEELQEVLWLLELVDARSGGVRVEDATDHNVHGLTGLGDFFTGELRSLPADHVPVVFALNINNVDFIREETTLLIGSCNRDRLAVSVFEDVGGHCEVGTKLFHSKLSSFHVHVS